MDIIQKLNNPVSSIGLRSGRCAFLIGLFSNIFFFPLRTNNFASFTDHIIINT